eukprot:TRINITY_DN25984_c0_g1_i2.p1 TRINITY_DN25984_c0_g1~~TRINITY_DN25984_c0_g1_i2.p1  ORF type:complete len:704 (+),score=162.39 TRINITY_DN25984_c0_g1_i2:75-2186(+)
MEGAPRTAAQERWDKIRVHFLTIKHAPKTETAHVLRGLFAIERGKVYNVQDRLARTRQRCDELQGQLAQSTGRMASSLQVLQQSVRELAIASDMPVPRRHCLPLGAVEERSGILSLAEGFEAAAASVDSLVTWLDECAGRPLKRASKKQRNFQDAETQVVTEEGVVSVPLLRHAHRRAALVRTAFAQAAAQIRQQLMSFRMMLDSRLREGEERIATARTDAQTLQDQLTALREEAEEAGAARSRAEATAAKSNVTIEMLRAALASEKRRAAPSAALSPASPTSPTLKVVKSMRSFRRQPQSPAPSASPPPGAAPSAPATPTVPTHQSAARPSEAPGPRRTPPRLDDTLVLQEPLERSLHTVDAGERPRSASHAEHPPSQESTPPPRLGEPQSTELQREGAAQRTQPALPALADAETVQLPHTVRPPQGVPPLAAPWATGAAQLPPPARQPQLPPPGDPSSCPTLGGAAWELPTPERPVHQPASSAELLSPSVASCGQSPTSLFRFRRPLPGLNSGKADPSQSGCEAQIQRALLDRLCFCYRCGSGPQMAELERFSGPGGSRSPLKSPKQRCAAGCGTQLYFGPRGGVPLGRSELSMLEEEMRKLAVPRPMPYRQRTSPTMRSEGHAAHPGQARCDAYGVLRPNAGPLVPVGSDGNLRTIFSDGGTPETGSIPPLPAFAAAPPPAALSPRPPAIRRGVPSRAVG